MATYRDIHGFKIQNVSSDPPTSVAGDVWYNSTSGVLKVNSGTLSGAWATGGTLNQSPDRTDVGGFGTKTAAICAGASPLSGITESYNGTSWTEVNDMNTGRTAGSATGTQTDGILAGGFPGTVTTAETWNGTNWTSISSMNSSKRYNNSAGISTSAIMFSGYRFPPGALVETELWNGTNWTEVNDMNVARYYGVGDGTSTAALSASGDGADNQTELWNGTNWTSVSNMPSGTQKGAGGGTTTSFFVQGGEPPPAGSTKTQFYNGSSWTEGAFTNSAHIEGSGAGSANSDAIVFAGFNKPTEEFSETGGIRTIDAS